MMEIVRRKKKTSRKLDICKMVSLQLRRALNQHPHPPRDGELSLRPREGFGMLLVVARNAFNELNRYVIMGAVSPMPPDARMAFNRYRHHSLGIVRNEMGEDPIIITREDGIPKDAVCLWCAAMESP